MSNQCKLSSHPGAKDCAHVCACVCHVSVRVNLHRCVFRQRTARVPSRAEDFLSLQTLEDKKRKRTVSDVLG